jgi:hypothetical protein
MFGFLPNSLFTTHRAQSTTGLSPRLWANITQSMMSASGDKRLFLMGDDFGAIHHADTLADLHSEMPYIIFTDDTSNHTITGAADEKGGVLQLNIDAGADANEELGIMAGDGTQQMLQISDTAGDEHLTAFECRIKISTVTDGKAALIAGLGQPGIVAAGGVIDTDGGPMADKAFIGFSVLADDGDSVDFCYQGASQTRQDKIAGAGTLTADTFIKLGFLYDPAAPAANRISVYVDNVLQSTYVTATNIAAATFPDAESLAFVLQTKGIAGSLAIETAIDWWAAAQLI